MADIGGHLGMGAAFPLPRNSIGRRIAHWVIGTIETARARLQPRVRASGPKRPSHYPRREPFLEDAAMSREMFRL